MNRKRSLFAVIATDILCTGLILVVFAFFHHVLPAIRASEAKKKLPPPPVQTAAPVKQTPTPMPEPESPEEPEKELTEWQRRFAEHFSDEVIVTENSYTSPTSSVTIEKVVTGEGDDTVTYFVADIYVADISRFRTWVANGKFEYFSTQDVMEMDAACDAIVSVNGDFYSYQPTGFLVRNGEVYKRDMTYCDLCVLFEDGTVECFARHTYDIDELLARGVWQAWNFGPSLLDEEGHVKRSYEMPSAVSFINPRSALGYYEPGHYCFVLVDGRQQGYSKGMTMQELAAVFESLGCTCAYNLDGGGSAVMTFDHEKYSRQSNSGDRELGDILLITDTIPDESVSFLQEVQ